MTNTGSGANKQDIEKVINALTTSIIKLRQGDPTFREVRAAAFLEAIKATIEAWCRCQNADGDVQSYYEYPA